VPRPVGTDVAAVTPSVTAHARYGDPDIGYPTAAEAVPWNQTDESSPLSELTESSCSTGQI
jgi:hypothetical protein